MAFSLPRSVVSSSRTSIPPACMMPRRPPNPNLFVTPSLTTPSHSEVNINALTDEHLILTRKRHSDFNPHTIQNDHRHAGEFLRWKEWNLKNQSMLKTKMIRTGDFLVAEPGHTHTGDVGGNSTKLLESRIFKIQLLEPLSDSQSQGDLGFRCRLVSINDTVLPSTPTAPSKLCVKLYDDRFFPSPSTEEGPVSVWYKPGDKHCSAEDYIRSELVGYQQEAGRRWRCYGAFKFVLSRNGHWLNGLLMEDLGQRNA